MERELATIAMSYTIRWRRYFLICVMINAFEARCPEDNAGAQSIMADFFQAELPSAS